MPYPRSNLSRQKGAALVVALLIFALCTALIVAMKREFILYYQRGANVFVSEQIYAYLRGAEELAALALVVDYDADLLLAEPRDDLTEDWAQDPDDAIPRNLDEGGWLRGGLEDLQGRFNLNSLVDKRSSEQGKSATRYTVAQKQFIRLLQALPELQLSEQEAIAITESIGDWLDEDGQPRASGAENDFYLGETPPYRPANQLLSSVSELQAVANITPPIYEALRPWIAALPDQRATLNILTAPAMLLRTINADTNLQPLSEADGESLRQARANQDFVDVEGFIAQPVFAAGTLAEIEPKLGISSSYFLMSGEAKVADRKLRLYSVLERKNRVVTTLIRSGEGLCPTEQKEGKFCKTVP